MELDKNLTSHLDVYPAFLRPGWAEHSARFISAVSSPPILATTGIALAAQAAAQSSAWLWAAVFITLSIVPPLLYVLWLVRSGRVSDFHLNIREQRTVPLLVALASATFSWFVLLTGGAPALLVTLAAGATIEVFLIFLLTLRWKISGHSAAVAGVAVLALMLFGQAAVLFTAAVPFVAWSRVRLRRHTLSQVVSGALLGGLMVALTILFYQGWIENVEITNIDFGF